MILQDKQKLEAMSRSFKGFWSRVALYYDVVEHKRKESLLHARVLWITNICKEEATKQGYEEICLKGWMTCNVTSTWWR